MHRGTSSASSAEIILSRKSRLTTKCAPETADTECAFHVIGKIRPGIVSGRPASGQSYPAPKPKTHRPARTRCPSLVPLQLSRCRETFGSDPSHPNATHRWQGQCRPRSCEQGRSTGPPHGGELLQTVTAASIYLQCGATISARTGTLSAINTDAHETGAFRSRRYHQSTLRLNNGLGTSANGAHPALRARAEASQHETRRYMI